MQEQRISLFYKDASSDKEYHAQLLAEADGFVVTFQYGKRGGTLTEGRKTATPVAYDKALKVYDKLVKEKTGKGYTPADSAALFVGTSLEERFTGIVPQLLNPIDDGQADELVADDDWILQEKYDGHRRMLRNDGATSFGINRKGLAVGMPEEVAQCFAALARLAPLTLDGELMGTTYAIYDILEMSGKDVRELSYKQRLELLEELSILLDAAGVSANFFVVPTWFKTQDKREQLAKLRATGAEGGVFKRLDSLYVAGRPNSGGNQVKRKFTHSASVLVSKAHPTKRSVAVEAFDEAGAKVALGNVTIPSNYDIPVAGAIVEVEYLYAYPGGSLFQPQYKGVRDDIDEDACVLSQLHYKRGTDEDSDEN